MNGYESYHDLLQQEFEKRKQINSAYSLRAFARDLGFSAPRLSQVLNKKQGLSVSAAEDVAEKLKLGQEEKDWFCDSVGALHARNFKKREEFSKKIEAYKENAKSFTELQLEYFKVISDWYHFAILELTYLEDFQSDKNWIAETLGITLTEVIEAIERMKSLNLIREVDGKLEDVFQYLATGNDIPSLSLKKFNIQLMKLAMEALYDRDIHEREFSSNVISISKEQLPEYKQKLRDFRNQFDFEAGNNPKKDAVYCLSMQFFELTRKDQ